MNKKSNYTLLVLLWVLIASPVFSADFRVAVRAKDGIENAIKQWQPTIDYLNEQIPQHRFLLKPMLNLNTITKAAQKAEFDFIFTNPSSYVEIQELVGLTGLATLNNKRANTAQTEFGTVMFTHVRHTDILSITDLKNKTLMAVSAPAFGGWRVAWLEMLEQGFDPHKDLKALLFTQSKTQPEVVWAVRDGQADAGVVRTDLLERLEASGKLDMRYFRIINNKEIESFPFFLSTPLYPEWAFAALKTVPDAIAKQVREALHRISRESHAAQSGHYIGWVPIKDYSSVKLLMQRLKVGPYKED